jgi:ribonuclease HI
VRILPPDPGLLIVSCDGASRGNPGPAGIGVQITDERGAVLAEIAEGLGETTNNVAEYTAAREGLRRAAELGASSVHLRSDSQLLIEQLSGRYKVKAAHLRPLYSEVVAEMARFERVGLEHIPRERNREADRLANEGVDDWLRRRPRS